MKSEASFTDHPINSDLHEIQSSRSDISYILAPYSRAAVSCKTLLPPIAVALFKSFLKLTLMRLNSRSKHPFLQEEKKVKSTI